MAHDKIVVLKPTKSGYKADTVIVQNANDTLALSVDVSGDSYLTIPDTPIVVETPGKDNWDYLTSSLTLLGALIAAWYTFKLIRGLKDDNKHKQDQINQLASQTKELAVISKSLEKTVRQNSRPNLWINGAGGVLHNKFRIWLENHGRTCFIEAINQLEGDEIEVLTGFNNMPLENGGHFDIQGQAREKPTHEAQFSIELIFYDFEDFKYRMTVQFENGRITTYNVEDI